MRLLHECVWSKVTVSTLTTYLLLMTVACLPKEEHDTLPNIILVMADDLGYGDISIYRPENKIKTPNIDQIAKEGLLFTDAHSPSSVCTPTRYGLLTGRYSWRTRLKRGVLTGKSKALIPNSRSTVASILRHQGYQTAFIGKWHLGWDWGVIDQIDTSGEGWNAEDFDNLDFTKPISNSPQELGFDYSYGHSGSLDMAPYVYVENGAVTEVPDTVTVDKGKYSWWREGPTSRDFVHDDVTPNFFRRGIEFVKESAAKNKPFFLYLPLPSPHTPILPTERWKGKSGLNDYGDFMIMIDDYMGQLLTTLDEAGLKDNTIVIFTSDNGCSPAAGFDEMLKMAHLPNAHYRGYKADIYEGGHRVPFVIRWPKYIQSGRTSDETICLTDLLATFAELSDYHLSGQEGEDSYSLLSLLKGKEVGSPIREATVHHSINGSFAIRKDEWKLIMCPGSGGWSFPKPEDPAIDTLPNLQLYNLKSDPGETNNVVSANPQKVTELKGLLIKYIRNGRSTPGQPQSNDDFKGSWDQISFVND